MRVLNKYRDGPVEGQVYIGRGSPYGNPFRVGRDGDRGAVISKFEIYARNRLRTEPLWLRPLLDAEALVCFCKPSACHGDVIVRLLKELYG